MPNEEGSFISPGVKGARRGQRIMPPKARNKQKAKARGKLKGDKRGR